VKDSYIWPGGDPTESVAARIVAQATAQRRDRTASDATLPWSWLICIKEAVAGPAIDNVAKQRPWRTAMTNGLDPEMLAYRLATIACATSDSTTGVRLLEVVGELLEQAGLLPAGSLGGRDSSND
jgi:hypothetical protein